MSSPDVPAGSAALAALEQRAEKLHKSNRILPRTPNGSVKRIKTSLDAALMRLRDFRDDLETTQMDELTTDHTNLTIKLDNLVESIEKTKLSIISQRLRLKSSELEIQSVELHDRTKRTTADLFKINARVRVGLPPTPEPPIKSDINDTVGSLSESPTSYAFTVDSKTPCIPDDKFYYQQSNETMSTLDSKLDDCESLDMVPVLSY